MRGKKWELFSVRHNPRVCRQEGPSAFIVQALLLRRRRPARPHHRRSRAWWRHCSTLASLSQKRHKKAGSIRLVVWFNRGA